MLGNLFNSLRKENGAEPIEWCKNGNHLLEHTREYPQGICMLCGYHGKNTIESKENNMYIYYECSECRVKWINNWSCMCNDKCPKCNKEIEPYKSVETFEPDNFNNKTVKTKHENKMLQGFGCAIGVIIREYKLYSVATNVMEYCNICYNDLVEAGVDEFDLHSVRQAITKG